MNGIKLPHEGANFAPYSTVGWAAGRTYVHSTVHAVVLDAYQTLATTMPKRSFLYGETGWEEGGSFKPHRTHQNGLSVDFMVPVVDANGEPAPLPTGPLNKFGYALDFDKQGRLDDLRIDFEAIAAHLAALSAAARARRIGIAKVIFDPILRQQLAKTESWKHISGLPFSKASVWVRHDDHYHVDFAMHCSPMN